MNFGLKFSEPNILATPNIKTKPMNKSRFENARLKLETTRINDTSGWRVQMEINILSSDWPKIYPRFQFILPGTIHFFPIDINIPI